MDGAAAGGWTGLGVVTACGWMDLLRRRNTI
jgi:hypothetical protein